MEQEFETVGQVTKPRLKLNTGVAQIVKIVSEPYMTKKPMRNGAPIKSTLDPSKDMEPFEAVDVTTPDNPNVKQIMGIPGILGGSLKEAYPKNTFVGRFFSITKFAQPGGGKPCPYDVMEVKPKAKK